MPARIRPPYAARTRSPGIEAPESRSSDQTPAPLLPLLCRPRDGDRADLHSWYRGGRSPGHRRHEEPEPQGSVESGHPDCARTSATGAGEVAEAGQGRAGGVHVHATLDQVEGPVGTLKLLIDATAWSSDDNLTGIGYDALPDLNNPSSVNSVQIGPSGRAAACGRLPGSPTPPRKM